MLRLLALLALQADESLDAYLVERLTDRSPGALQAGFQATAQTA
jgi:hypothetical protein